MGIWMRIKLRLLWLGCTIGVIRMSRDETIVWPFHWPSWEMFWFYMRGGWGKRFYVFRNLPGVIKRVPGRLLPRRWGFGFCGIEFGDRGG